VALEDMARLWRRGSDVSHGQVCGTSSFWQMLPLVLVVQDEAAVAEVTCRMVEASGYRTDCASTGKQAIALLEEGTIRPDLAILDVHLPDMKGTEVALVLQNGDRGQHRIHVGLSVSAVEASRVRGYDLPG
jgi:two-component system phosphate regulon response regulator PhoB